MKLIALCILLLMASSASADDFDYSAYQATSLAAVIASANIDPRADYYFDVALPRYRTVGTFTGNSRAIDHRVGDFISMWAYTDQLPTTYREIFNTEVELKQDSKTYWMPIQQSLVEFFRREVEAGHKVTLYLLFMGEYNHSAVFAICGFDSAEV